jgi:hypothetical protein
LRVTRRGFWWAATAPLLVVVSAVVGSLWTNVDVGVLPTPVRADWEIDRYGPSLIESDGAYRPETLHQMLQKSNVVALVRLDTGETEEVRVGERPEHSHFTGFRFTVVEPVAGVRGGDQIPIY